MSGFGSLGGNPFLTQASRRVQQTSTPSRNPVASTSSSVVKRTSGASANEAIVVSDSDDDLPGPSTRIPKKNTSANMRQPLTTPASQNILPRKKTSSLAERRSGIVVNKPRKQLSSMSSLSNRQVERSSSSSIASSSSIGHGQLFKKEHVPIKPTKSLPLPHSSQADIKPLTNRSTDKTPIKGDRTNARPIRPIPTRGTSKDDPIEFLSSSPGSATSTSSTDSNFLAEEIRKRLGPSHTSKTTQPPSKALPRTPLTAQMQAVAESSGTNREGNVGLGVKKQRVSLSSTSGPQSLNLPGSSTPKASQATSRVKLEPSGSAKLAQKSLDRVAGRNTQSPLNPRSTPSTSRPTGTNPRVASGSGQRDLDTATPPSRTTTSGSQGSIYSPSRSRRARPVQGAYTIPPIDATEWPTRPGTQAGPSRTSKKRPASTLAESVVASNKRNNATPTGSSSSLSSLSQDQSVTPRAIVAGLTPKRKGTTPSTSSLSSLSQDNRATPQPAVQRKGAASSSLSPPPASAMEGAGADSEPEDAVGVDDLLDEFHTFEFAPPTPQASQKTLPRTPSATPSKSRLRSQTPRSQTKPSPSRRLARLEAQSQPKLSLSVVSEEAEKGPQKSRMEDTLARIRAEEEAEARATAERRARYDAAVNGTEVDDTTEGDAEDEPMYMSDLLNTMKAKTAPQEVAPRADPPPKPVQPTAAAPKREPNTSDKTRKERKERRLEAKNAESFAINDRAMTHVAGWLKAKNADNPEETGSSPSKDVAYPTPKSLSDPDELDHDGLERALQHVPGVDAEAIKAVKRSKREKLAEVEVAEWSGFWEEPEPPLAEDEDAGEEIDSPALDLDIDGVQTIDALLWDLIAGKNLETLSVMMQSGIFDQQLSRPGNMPKLAHWCLTIALRSGDDVAQAHALNCLEMVIGGIPGVAACPFDADAPEGRSGVLDVASAVLASAGMKEVWGMEQDDSMIYPSKSRAQACGVAERLATFAVNACSIDSTHLLDLAKMLLLLSVDESISTTLCDGLRKTLSKLWAPIVNDYVPIDVARHLCAIFESADVRFVIRVQMVLAIGTRDEAAREISRWAAIGILLPGCLTMPATRSPITTGEGPHEDYVRSSAVLNAKDRSLAHENNAVPGIDLLKDAGKLLKEQVAVDEPDHIRISNMITLLVESMTEMDTLVDQIAGMAESTREESVLDEIEFQIHDFVKLTIEAHNKIIVRSTDGMIESENKSRLSQIQTNVRQLLLSTLKRRQRKRAAAMKGMKMGTTGQMQLAFAKAKPAGETSVRGSTTAGPSGLTTRSPSETSGLPSGTTSRTSPDTA